MAKRGGSDAVHLIDVALRDRKWFQDGKPSWTEARGKRWERPCRTSTESSQLRCDSVRLLRRHGKDLPAAEQVADRLDECFSRSRCLSGACPQCSRAHQRWFVARSRRLIHGPLRKIPLVIVTIAPDFGQRPMDRLNTLDTKATWLKTARILRNAGIHVAFGATDFSVNVEWNGREPYLQVHFTSFIPTNQWPKSDGKLRKAFNQSH